MGVDAGPGETVTAETLHVYRVLGWRVLISTCVSGPAVFKLKLPTL